MRTIGEVPTLHHMDSSQAFTQAVPASDEPICTTATFIAGQFAGRTLRVRLDELQCAEAGRDQHPGVQRDAEDRKANGVGSPFRYLVG